LKLDSLEKVYTKIHDEIRKNPEKVKKEKTKPKLEYQDKRRTIVVTGKKDKNGKPVLYKRDRALTYDERKAAVNKKSKKLLKESDCCVLNFIKVDYISRYCYCIYFWIMINL